MSRAKEPFSKHELLDSAKLAELLGATPRGIAQSRRRGLIPAGFRVPGVKGWRWRREDIDTWLSDQAAKAGAA